MFKAGLFHFEAVLAVARHRSFRAAAVELGVSTTALSSTVAGLEREMGVRLFNRTTRSVSLTEAGTAFTGRLAPALAEIRVAWDSASSSQMQPAGSLRINSSLGAARMAMATVLSEYARRYPAVTLDLVTEGRLVDIVAENFDAGLRASHLVPLDMVRVPIGGPIRTVVVATPAYLERFGTPASLDELKSHRCVRARLPSGAPSRWEFSDDGEAIEIDVPGPLVVDSPALMRDAALASLGLALVAEWHVAEDIRQGTLVTVLDEWSQRLPPLALYYPAGRHVPAALRALVALIREVQPAAWTSHSSAARKPSDW
jgi:DNA-binding transcriptional LysR family regulator